MSTKMTREQLLKELDTLRRRVAEMEALEAKRKQVEQMLAESEQKYRALAESSLEGVGISKENQIIFANKALLEMMGYESLEEFSRVPLLDIMAPETRAIVQERLEKRARGEWVEPLWEYKQIRKDGEIRHFEASSAEIVLGNEKYVQTTLRDITEQVQAEEVLRKSETKYRALFDATLDGTVVIDAETLTILAANEAAAKMYGFDSAKDAIGVSLLNFVAPEEKQRVVRVITEDLFQKDLREVNEFRTLTKDGRETWISALGIRTEYEGRLAGLISFRDITARKQAEHALRRSEENFRALVENANDGILITWPEGGIAYANRQATEITGYSVGELLEANVKQLAYPGDVKKLLRRYKERLEGKPVPSRYQTFIVREDGRLVPTETAAARTTWQGKPAFMFFIQDITERRRAEEALRESEERFRHVSYLTSDIAYSCSTNQDGVYAIDWMSGATERITGYTIDEIKAQSCWRFLVVDEDLPLFEKHVIGLSPGQSASCELRIRHKNGAIIWIASYADCLSEPKTPECLRLYGGLVDITERRRAEKALQESEAWFRGIYEDSPIAIELFDADGRLIGVNKACLDMFGQRDDTKLKWFKLLEDPYLPEDVKQKVRAGQVARYKTRWDFEEVKRLKLYETTRSDVAHLDAMVSPLGLSKGAPLRGYVVRIQDITERRRAEEALRESERKYRLLAENVTDLIYVLDMDMKVTYVSPSITRLLGFSIEEGMARGLTESLTPASLEVASKAWQNVLRVGKERPGGFRDRGVAELEMYRKDGSTVWVESLVTVMQDSGGRPVGIMGVTRDISQRKRAEEALRKSEERYRLLFNNYGDPITVYGIDGRLWLINAVGARNFGGRPENFVGKSYAELFPEQGSSYLERHRAAALSGIAVDFEDMVELPSGKRWFWSIIQPFRDEAGEMYAVQIVSHDITERKRAEVALRESEAKLRSAFESSPDIMYMVDRDFGIIFINRVLPGYDPKDVLGSKVTNWMPPQSQDIIKKSLEEVFLTGETQTLDMIGYGEHRSMAWYWVRFAPVKEGDRVLAALMTSRDITERKRAGEELRDAYERERQLRSELEEEMKKRVEFTRGLVHELKTPLTSVIASSELLALELPEGPLLRMARNINRSAENLNERINELLDVARGELGMLKLSLASVDPLRVLRGLAEDMGPVALSQHQPLLLDLPSALLPVWADEGRLRQVVLNLLSNACKFTGEGGKITLKAREEGDRLIVEVEDTGPGISEAEQQRLFTRYYRGEGDRERFSGLGLGLALCKTLVELHGGQIWVRSQPGKGSTFGFSVPLASESQIQGLE